MTNAEHRVIPFRPRPLTELPDSFFAFLDQAKGLPDATVMRLIDRHYPEAAAFLREAPTREPRANEDMVRRAVETTGPRPRVRVVRDDD